MVFSPAGYLRGLGWGGPGEGLNDSPNARAKPITIAQKKTLSGVGKDRDTAFPWWEMVFAAVAGKVSSGDKNTDHHRTSTGIISHLPPPKPSAYASLAPTPSTSSASGGINQSYLADAKMEAARRQLYSGFMKGSPIGASLEENEEDAGKVKSAKGRGKEVEVEIEVVEGKKRKRTKVEVDSEEEDTVMVDVPVVKLSKEERRAAKKLRREAREAATTNDDDDGVLVAPPSPPNHPSTDFISPKSQPTKRNRIVSTSTIISISTLTSLPDSDTTKPRKSNSKKSKRAVSPVVESVPRDYLSPEELKREEEKAYLEAREIVKRATKEAKRLEKIVKKALEESKKVAE